MRPHRARARRWADRLRGRIATWTTTGILVGASGCGTPSFGPEDEAAITAVMRAQQRAWNAGDIRAFMKGYHEREDLVFTSGGNIRRGYTATLNGYLKRYVEGPGADPEHPERSMGHLEFSDLEITGLGPGAAVILGHWQLTETPQAGGGVFTLVFTKEDKQWGIVLDHTSATAVDDSPS